MPTSRSVPGVAIYFYALQSVRARLAKFPSLAAPTASTASEKGSTLPKLTPQANLVSGACTRVAVGFLLSPLAVLKARFEVGCIDLQNYCATYGDSRAVHLNTRQSRKVSDHWYKLQAYEDSGKDFYRLYSEMHPMRGSSWRRMSLPSLMEVRASIDACRTFA